MDYRTIELSSYEKIRFRAAMAISGMIIGYLFYDSVIAGAAAGICMFRLEGPYRASLLQKRKQILAIQFKDLLYSMSALVSVGRDIGQALEESETFWKGTYGENDHIIREVREMVRKIRQSNMSDIDVLSDFALRSGLDDAEDLVMICATCKETGADLQKALQRGADIIGDKITMEREIQTIMSQKRFEGRLIAIAPICITAVVKAVSPEYLAPLTQTDAGRMVATLSLILMAAGFLTIERVNHIEI